MKEQLYIIKFRSKKTGRVLALGEKSLGKALLFTKPKAIYHTQLAQEQGWFAYMQKHK